ncbi:MAG: hypothetical protein AAF744_04620 [Pseudomonadota bacterium]
MITRLATALALFAAPLAAQDFSENSEARSWNLYAEVPATFEALVIDVMCELTGDCPENCGDGSRQMALLRTADEAIVMVMKNSQPAFSGAVVDLLPYCGQAVKVDGLMIEDPDFPIRNIYLVQRIKTAEADWARANQFTKVWAAENPEATGRGPWFRRDPRIAEEIAKEGYLGLGLDVDGPFLEYWFE